MKRILLSILTIATTFFIIQAQEVPKMILAEHFTNTNCSVCASKNPDFYSTINSYDNLMHIAYHPSIPYASCTFSQHNASENDARTQYYEIYNGTPRVVLNGNVISASTPMINSSQIDAVENEMTFVSIDATHQLLNTTEILSTVTIKTVANTSLDSATLYGLVAEAMVNYTGGNGESQHYDVFRKALNGDNGTKIELPAMGDSLVLDFQFVIDQEWTTAEVFTAFILQEDDNSLIQAAKSTNFNPITSVNDINQLDLRFYPNPTSTQLTIENPSLEIERVTIYNIIGKKVREIALNNRAKINFPTSSLENGSYLLEFTTVNGASQTRKLIVQH